MSGPIATLDPARPKISDELWKQSGTPLTGWLIRGWIALVLIAAGWILADVTGTVYPWALVAVGIAAFVAAPALVESLVLARLAAKVDAIERERNADRGHAVLDELRNNATVKMLAPHGWLRVQEGRIHLAVGDGRAAARAFAEAERVSTHPDKHALISAQAHALVLSGDRKEARELLGKLRKADQLSDLDHLNFGVVLLSEAGHNQEALAHLKQAREAFGDHPRALAGLMLALQRCDKTDESAALLGEAEAAVEASADQLAQDLLKRAKKGLRPLLKAKQKRERKTEKQVEPSEAGSSDKPHKPKGKKGRKQARRDARKKAKAEARHGTEPAATEASDEQATLDEGSKDVEAHDERDEAAEHERDDTVDHDDDASDDQTDHDDDASDDQTDHDDDASDDQTDHDDDASDDQPEREVNAQPVEVAPEPAAAGKRPASEDDGIDLASLALEALGSGSRRKLDESEGGPSASGLRPIEPSSSGSMFRSALFDDPKPASESGSSTSPSLFSLPKFDSVPTFAPPPKPTRGPLLPSRPSAAKPEAAKPEAAKPEPPKPVVAPGVTPPKLGPVAAPSIPVPKPIAPPKPSAKPPTPALDDGWGDLGDIDPFATPPASPAITDKAED